MIELLNMFLNNIEKKDKSQFKNTFKLPIEYIENKYILNNNIIDDLELKELKKNKEAKEVEEVKENEEVKEVEENEIDKYENLYYNVLNLEDDLQKKHTVLWSNYYTTDINFLNDTQDLLSNFRPNVNFENSCNNEEDSTKCINVYNNYEDIINDNNFIDKYQYIDFPFFEKYNNSERGMFFLSLYNLSSPILSLIVPIISLLIPFLIIKLQGFDITIGLYIEHLKVVMGNHVIGQLFSNFTTAPLSTKMYLIISIGIYVFQVYSNIHYCKKYFKNIRFINNTLLNIKKYIDDSIKYFNNYLKYSEKLLSYNSFNNKLKNNVVILEEFNKELMRVNVYSININKILEMGIIMKNFHMLYNNEELIDALYYSFDCRCYINNIIHIQKLIKNKVINKCNFITNSSNKNTSFKNSYFCNLIKTDSKNIIKNSYSLDDNLLLTGPNAAGKTTLLKSTLFNIILSQQIGYGFFDNANIKLYDYIHCYINIPDTSNRDSLFQAEARQCKNILEFIEDNPDKNHLCVFDELFSGTNPEDAIKSGYGYLNHINKKNVNFILTSHYHKLCKMLEKGNANIKNFHMEIKEDENNNFSYSYKIKKGINKKKGGLKVLNDLNFPKSMMNNINKIK